MSQHPEEPASCAEKLMCSLCRRRFTREKDFKAHENLHLSGKELFQCKECGLCYSGKAFLAKHIKSHQKCRTIQTPAKSSVADRIDEATSNFEEQIENTQGCQELVMAETDAEARENKFQCQICGRKLCGVTDLKIHEDLHVSGKEPFSCKDCGSCYWNKKARNNHERKCRQKKPRLDSRSKKSLQTLSVDQSAYCQKDASPPPPPPLSNETPRSSSRISKPLKRYDTPIKTPDNYKCDVCNKTFLAKNNLKIHKQLHGGDTSNKTESPSGNEICDDINSLNSNIIIVDDTHSTSQEPKTTLKNIEKRSDAVICLICSREFRKTFKLENHVELHESGKKPLNCHTCGWCFWTKKARQEHLKSHETIIHQADSSEFRCHLCNRQFKQAISLDTHVQLYTTGKKPLTCKVCGWHFWSRQALDGHEKSHKAHHPPENLTLSIGVQRKAKSKDLNVATGTQNHHTIKKIIELDAKKGFDKTGNRYPCLVCGRRLQDPKHLKYHEYLHTTNKKPLECRYCGHCYFEPASLRYHAKSCSRNVDAKAVKVSSQHESKGKPKVKNNKQGQPFKCSFCNREFRGPNELKVHENLHDRGNDALSCQVCGAQYRYRSKDQFKKHQTICRAKENYKRRGKISKEFKCGKGRKAYRDQERLRKHEAKHDYSGRRTSSRRVSKAEKYFIHPTKFSCSLCKKQFIGAKNLKIHMELHGSSASAAVAAEVPEDPPDSVWEERNDLSLMAEEPSEQEAPPRLVYVTTKGADDFDCLACGREFDNAIKLRAHLQLHESKETPYVCPLCNWCFWNEPDLAAHDNERHSSLTKKSKDDDTSPQHSGSKNMPEELDTISLDSSSHQSVLDTPSKVLTCEGCKQCFWSVRQLELHQLKCDIKSQDPEDYLDFEEDNKPFHCVTCNTFFATLSQLELHEATHKINQGQ